MRTGAHAIGLLPALVAILVSASSAYAGMAPCTPSQLRAVAGLQGATGSQLGGISLVNRGVAACTLPRSAPRVSFVWRGRLAVRQVAFPLGWLDSQYSRGSTQMHVLQPGRTTFVVLQWWNWCGPRPWGRGFFPGVLEVRLAGSRGRVIARLRGAKVVPPFCNAPPSTLRVSGFLRPT